LKHIVNYDSLIGVNILNWLWVPCLEPKYINKGRIMKIEDLVVKAKKRR